MLIQKSFCVNMRRFAKIVNDLSVVFTHTIGSIGTLKIGSYLIGTYSIFLKEKYIRSYRIGTLRIGTYSIYTYFAKSVPIAEVA